MIRGLDDLLRKAPDLAKLAEKNKPIIEAWCKVKGLSMTPHSIFRRESFCHNFWMAPNEGERPLVLVMWDEKYNRHAETELFHMEQMRPYTDEELISKGHVSRLQLQAKQTAKMKIMRNRKIGARV